MLRRCYVETLFGDESDDSSSDDGDSEAEDSDDCSSATNDSDVEGVRCVFCRFDDTQCFACHNFEIDSSERLLLRSGKTVKMRPEFEDEDGDSAVQAEILDDTAENRSVMQKFFKQVISDAWKFARHADRHHTRRCGWSDISAVRISAMDVAYALQQQDRTIYGINYMH